jgi:hypothetical protein
MALDLDEAPGLTVRPTRVAARAATSLGLGLIGVSEVVAAFLVLEAHLPPSIPSEFASPGLNLPLGSTVGLVESMVITIVVLSLVFTGLSALTSDSEPLEWMPLGRIVRFDAVHAIAGSITLVGAPWSVIVLLMGAAGTVPKNLPVGTAALLVGVVPLLIVSAIVVYALYFPPE